MTHIDRASDTRPGINIEHVIPKIWVKEFVNEGGLKKSVLKELLAPQYKDGIDIRPLIREYIEGIGKIQEKIRELTQFDVQRWEGAFSDTRKRFQDEYGSDINITHIAVVAKSDENKIVDSIITCRVRSN